MSALAGKIAVISGGTSAMHVMGFGDATTRRLTARHFIWTL